MLLSNFGIVIHAFMAYQQHFLSKNKTKGKEKKAENKDWNRIEENQGRKQIGE